LRYILLFYQDAALLDRHAHPPRFSTALYRTVCFTFILALRRRSEALIILSLRGVSQLRSDKIWVANRKDNVRAADRPYVEFSLADGWGKAEAFAATPNPVPVPVAMSKR